VTMWKKWKSNRTNDHDWGKRDCAHIEYESRSTNFGKTHWRLLREIFGTRSMPESIQLQSNNLPHQQSRWTRTTSTKFQSIHKRSSHLAAIVNKSLSINIKRKSATARVDSNSKFNYCLATAMKKRTGIANKRWIASQRWIELNCRAVERAQRTIQQTKCARKQVNTNQEKKTLTHTLQLY